MQQIADLLEAAQEGVVLLPKDTIGDIGPLNLPGFSLGPLPISLIPPRWLTIAAPNGINIPELKLSEGVKLALPEIAVPLFGPAGTYDQVAALEGDFSTQLLLSLVKTLQANTGLLAVLDQLGIDLPPELAAISNLIQKIPLNVPNQGTTLEIDITEFNGDPFLDLDLSLLISTATKLAILPSWGLGGTNIAFTAPYFLNEEKFADTVILAIPLRNTSRPGGGIVALLNPLSSLVGINLSNVDGREGNGNVTFWDITAAYDILSDAPSTVFNPVAWANAATGAVMPTYLIPSNVEQLASVLENVVSGNIGLDTILDLLAAGDITKLFHTELGDDGNLYITYDSGHLPLLEPFQFLPRTISYLPGFDISTPVSESFNDLLTQMVAMGYQDVAIEGGNSKPSFVRQWNMAGNQAQFWTSPVSFEKGLQVPQALLNALIGADNATGADTGLVGNLLNPDEQSLTLFGNTALGDLVYDNPVTVAVAGFLQKALVELKNQLNPLLDKIDSNETIVDIARALDRATGEVNNLLAKGGDAVKGLDINLSDPLMDLNRGFNKVFGGLTLDQVTGASDSTPNTIMAAKSTPQLTQKSGIENALDSVGISSIGEQFSDNALSKTARSIAKELKSQSGGLDAKVQKQSAKMQKSLDKNSEKLKGIGSSLSKGDVGDAAEGAANFVKDRVERLGKDIKNGVDKVTGKEKPKATADAA